MKLLREALLFSKRQKKGGLILIGILGSLLLLKQFAWKTHEQPSNRISFPKFSHSSATEIQNVPVLGLNTSSAEQLQQIPGLGPVLSTRVVKYRAAIRGFQQIEDLKQVYGISNERYTQIIPFLKIDSFPNSASHPQKRTYVKKQGFTSIEINSANLEDFQQFRGVGSVLGKRIIKFREALGQFRSVEEIAKVYKLPDSTFQLMYPYLYLDTTLLNKGKKPSIHPEKNYAKKSYVFNLDTASLSPIDINRADSSIWAQVPGISQSLARRIIRYREIIGFYSKVEYLAQVYGFSPDHLNQLKPFLRVGDLDTFAKLDLNTQSHKKLKKYPFWEEGEWDAFIKWKKKIRRIDSWEEVASSQTLSPSTLTQMKSYFTL